LIHGTLVRLKVERLPGERDAKPLWLWSSASGIDAERLGRIWRTFQRRFDLEHTFRLIKQTLGWTTPKIRRPYTADLWTWLVIVAHTQLRLARPLAEDLRRLWEKPAPPNKLTPARVRRGFRTSARTHPARQPCHNRHTQAPAAHREGNPLVYEGEEVNALPHPDRVLVRATAWRPW
jgi:hypothetical protein